MRILFSNPSTGDQRVVSVGDFTPPQAAQMLGLTSYLWRVLGDNESIDLELSDEARIRQQINNVDAEVSAAIVAGFDYTIQGQALHFSYDTNDQQNFVDAFNAVSAAQSGVPGIPETLAWNGWKIDGDTRTLVVLELSHAEFLELYFQGAVTHKLTQITIGRQRKQELFDQLAALQNSGDTDGTAGVENAMSNQTDAAHGIAS